MNTNHLEELQTHTMELVDIMVGCACDLNQHTWETLVKTRSELVEYLEQNLSKSDSDKF